MRIAYLARIPYRHNNPSGGFAHMRQFLTHAAERGNDIVLWHGGEFPHSGVRAAPTGRLAPLLGRRQMDGLFYPVEDRLPRDCQLMLPPPPWLLINPHV